MTTTCPACIWSCPLPQLEFEQPKKCVPSCEELGVKLQLAGDVRPEPEQPNSGSPVQVCCVPPLRVTRSAIGWPTWMVRTSPPLVSKVQAKFDAVRFTFDGPGVGVRVGVAAGGVGVGWKPDVSLPPATAPASLWYVLTRPVESSVTVRS